MSNYMDRFMQWQNYVHYILLTIGLFIWHAIPYTAIVESSGCYFFMFLWYLLGLFIVDSIVHAIFWFMPEPIRWRD